MRLKLGTLQRIVDRATADERCTADLREEVTRALGQSVVVNVKLDALAEGANYRLDVLERTGRSATFKRSIVEKFLVSDSAEARRLAARVLPTVLAARLREDRDPAVRHAVARRLPVRLVREMLAKSPADDELRLIYRDKKLQEAGMKAPEKRPLGTDVSLDAEPLGDAVKQNPGAELSKRYYEVLAHKFISDYGDNMEGQWEAPLAHRYCSSVKATSGVQVDEKKLYDEIMRQLEEKDDNTLERNSLKETVQHLRESSTEMPEFSDPVNPVHGLLSHSGSSSEYVAAAMKVFSVRESTIPHSLHKFRFAEGRREPMRVPCTGQVPENKAVGSLEERALDRFCECWNEVQIARGEPVHIEWSHNPGGTGKVSFTAVLK